MPNTAELSMPRSRVARMTREQERQLCLSVARRVRTRLLADESDEHRGAKALGVSEVIDAIEMLQE